MQELGEQGRVAGHVGQADRNIAGAVEVAAEPDVGDAGDLADVVDVVGASGCACRGVETTVDPCAFVTAAIVCGWL